jgi:small subunit ribosomal protein S17
MDSKIKNRKTREGVVVSNKMTSSILVDTQRQVSHKLYGKMIRVNKKYMADDPQDECKIGDKVVIEECRPLSKNKRWRLRKIVEKAV